MRRIRSLACIAAVLALAACAVPPVRYYSLAATPVASATAAPERPAGAGAQVHLEVGPVGVAERLAKPQIVIRSNGGDSDSARIQVLEQQRWSSTFDSELRDAFGSDPERIVGFIFIGTPSRPLDERPRPDMSRIVSHWTA